MNSEKELDVMKEAARRLEIFFAARGMDVKHAVALEALTASLGARSWRAVRDKLSRPDAAVAPEVNPVFATEGLEPEKRFLVRGRLVGSGLAYSRMFNVYNARIAAFTGVAQRWLEGGEDLEVLEVLDRTSGQVTKFEGFSRNRFIGHTEAFRIVLEETRQLVTPVVAAAGVDCFQSESDLAALAWFEKPLQFRDFAETLDRVLDDSPAYRGVLAQCVTYGNRTGYVCTGTTEDFFIGLVNVLERHDDRFPEHAWDALCQVYALYHVCIPGVAAVYAQAALDCETAMSEV